MDTSGPLGPSFRSLRCKVTDTKNIRSILNKDNVVNPVSFCGCTATPTFISSHIQCTTRLKETYKELLAVGVSGMLQGRQQILGRAQQGTLSPISVQQVSNREGLHRLPKLWSVAPIYKHP